MKLIGFNFTKISAEVNKNFSAGKINTSTKFLDIEKDQIDTLNDSNILKIKFEFLVKYSDKNDESKPTAEIILEGIIFMSIEKNEEKEMLKSWKNKEIAEKYRNGLVNLLLNKCSIRALSLEEEMGLPPHMPFPMINNNQQPKKN